jgi:hypothetical protein
MITSAFFAVFKAQQHQASHHLLNIPLGSEIHFESFALHVMPNNNILSVKLAPCIGYRDCLAFLQVDIEEFDVQM